MAPDQWATQIESLRETGIGIAIATRPPRHEETLEAADVGFTMGRTGLEIEAAGVAHSGAATNPDGGAEAGPALPGSSYEFEVVGAPPFWMLSQSA